MNLLALLQMLMMIAHTVQTVETVMPDSPGTVKLKAATDTVVDAFDGASQIVPQVQTAISAVVGVFNAAKVGAFNK